MSMIDFDVNGVVFCVRNDALGDVGEQDAFGKPLKDWVASTIPAAVTFVPFASVENPVKKLQAVIDPNKSITVALFCDTPLVSAKTVATAISTLKNGSANVLELPRGYVFKTDYLFKTDVIYSSAKSVDSEFAAVVDMVSLSAVKDELRRRILEYHASRGVFIADFNSTFIDCEVVLERGAIIEPYNFIKGKSVVHAGAHIKPGNYIESCAIGEGAVLDSSRLYESTIGANTSVGPFAYIRPKVSIGIGCRIGDFVELKNCTIGNGSKVSHLSYVGDAELGKNCNVGCGVVFVNYDGKNKHRAVVGNRVFIGSNSNLIAPVIVRDGAFIAAGSTITDSVPNHALAIARARQSVIENWKGNLYAPVNDECD